MNNLGDHQEWWGYQHVSGTYHVKPYREALDIIEANESPFCKHVVGPFMAKNRDDALYIAESLVNYLNDKEPSEAEQQLYFFIDNTTGSFMTNLFKCIMSADIHNQAKLAKGFPEHVEVAYKHMNSPGYWENLEQRMQKSFKEKT